MAQIGRRVEECASLLVRLTIKQVADKFLLAAFRYLRGQVNRRALLSDQRFALSVFDADFNKEPAADTAPRVVHDGLRFQADSALVLIVPAVLVELVSLPLDRFLGLQRAEFSDPLWINFRGAGKCFLD